MTKRELIHKVLRGERPPYVPWQFGFTHEAYVKLQEHYGPDVESHLDNAMLWVAGSDRLQQELSPGHFVDLFGVRWDRTVDRDIGVLESLVLPEPTLAGWQPPDPRDPRLFQSIDSAFAHSPDRFRVYAIGFSLYERAWTLRGMENLCVDLIEEPDFIDDLFDALADFNIEQLDEACKYDFDAVYFGDDWGQQHGLQMGRPLWERFILPRLRRMYGAAKDRGKRVFIHSCGDVDELFDTLIDAGVDCFNPFQPEVMDVRALLDRYRGRLTFHGGLSTQRTLPYGTVEQVRAESRDLLCRGLAGGYIFAPSHAVEGDVPLENMLAFIEEAQSQHGVPA